MPLIQETMWMNQLYSDKRFEPLTNSGRYLTWAYNLKRLKSYLQISATNWLKVSFIVFLLRQLSKHTTTHIQLFLQIFLSIFKFFGSFICVSRISICWLFSIMDRAWSCSNFLKYGSWKSIRAVKHSFIKSIK